MKLFYSVILVFFLSVSSVNACPALEKMGMPVSNDSGLILLCRHLYATDYNTVTKTPKWSAEDLTADNASGPENRTNPFKADPDLQPGNRAELSDYQHSGYSRGHMSPAGDFRKEYMVESFYLSNMVPQVQNCNNAGIWSNIEEVVRGWAVKYGELYVVTGPIYENGITNVIGNKVAIPSHLFKVIYNPVLQQSVAFIVENKSLCDTEPSDVVVSQDAVEGLTGLRFFPNITNYTRSNIIWK